jgi:transposase InsO family protein
MMQRKKKTISEAVEEAYQDSALSHPNEVYQRAKKWNNLVTFKHVKRFLQGKDSYTLYRRVRRKPRVWAATLSKCPGDTFQCDLMEVHQLERYNDGVKYLLCCIDGFSKKAWVRALARKTSSVVAAAFLDILDNSETVPRHVQTDDGKEFTGEPFQRILKSNSIKWHSTYSDSKAAIVERFNQTLRGLLARRLEERQSNRYIDQLQNIVSSYNNLHHSTIGRSPNSVNSENEKDVWIHQFGERVNTTNPFRFNKTQNRSNLHRWSLGQKVRLLNRKGTFGRGYVEQWTRELFEIYELIVKSRSVPVYLVRDLDGENVKGFFYDFELQPVAN